MIQSVLKVIKHVTQLVSILKDKCILTQRLPRDGVKIVIISLRANFLSMFETWIKGYIDIFSLVNLQRLESI